MKICYVVGNSGKLPEKSTTLDLAVESSVRGHQVYFLGVKQFKLVNAEVLGKVKEVKETITEREELSDLLKRTKRKKEFPLMDMDVIFIRHVPRPSTKHYYDRALEFLDIVRERGVYVINKPRSINLYSPKVIVTNCFRLKRKVLPEKQLISHSLKDIYTFCENELGSNAVAKSLSEFSCGGKDVYFLEESNKPQWKDTIRNLLRKGYVVVQSYVPNSGDKRVLMLEGKPIGWYERRGAEGQKLHNMSRGGTALPCDLSEQERYILDRIGPRLIRQGLDFVGVDLLGGYLTEINSNNPGGTVNICKTTGRNIRSEVISYLEDKVEEYKKR